MSLCAYQRDIALLLALSPSAGVYLACGATDMRKGAVGLAMLVQQSLLEDPFYGVTPKGTRTEGN